MLQFEEEAKRKHACVSKEGSIIKGENKSPWNSQLT